MICVYNLWCSSLCLIHYIVDENQQKFSSQC